MCAVALGQELSVRALACGQELAERAEARGQDLTLQWHLCCPAAQRCTSPPAFSAVLFLRPWQLCLCRYQALHMSYSATHLLPFPCRAQGAEA